MIERENKRPCTPFRLALAVEGDRDLCQRLALCAFCESAVADKLGLTLLNGGLGVFVGLQFAGAWMALER